MFLDIKSMSTNPVQLVRPTGLSSWSVKLVRPVGLSSWSVQLVRPAGPSSWSVQLVHPAGLSSWYILLVCIQSCNVPTLQYCQKFPKLAKSRHKLQKVAISSDNVQTETVIFEYANWQRLQI